MLGGLRLASGKLVTHEPTGSHSRSSHGLGGEQRGAEPLTDLMEREVVAFISCSSQEGWDANSRELS